MAGGLLGVETPPRRDISAPPSSVPGQQGRTPAPEFDLIQPGTLRTPVADRVHHHHVLMRNCCGRCIRSLGLDREYICKAIRTGIARDTLTIC